MFRPAVPILSGARFDALKRRLAVVAVDLESGRRVVLHDGEVLPAIRATCAVPAVLPPVEVGGRWLVDGGLVSVLPVDVAAMAGHRGRGGVAARAPPAMARAGGDGASAACSRTRSRRSPASRSSCAPRRSRSTGAAMIGPEVLGRVDMGDIGLRDFHRLDDAVAAGRRAMEAALPAIRAALESRPPPREPPAGGAAALHLDPICDMVVDPRQAVALTDAHGRTTYFCSTGCRAAFARDASQEDPS